MVPSADVYKRQDYRYEMEGDSKGYNYKEEENLGKMGYQKQEFDSEKQELVNADEMCIRDRDGADLWDRNGKRNRR